MIKNYELELYESLKRMYLNGQGRFYDSQSKQTLNNDMDAFRISRTLHISLHCKSASPIIKRNAEKSIEDINIIISCLESILHEVNERLIEKEKRL